MRDIQARQKELERKWAEEVDAPKMAAKRGLKMQGKRKPLSEDHWHRLAFLLVPLVNIPLQILDCQHRQFCVLMPLGSSLQLLTPDAS
jgi:hypothetical protein